LTVVFLGSLHPNSMVEGEAVSEGFGSLEAIWRYIEQFGYNLDSYEGDEVTQEIDLAA
jgi:hypothetical protein